MRTAFGVEHEISKKKGLGKSGQYALRRLQRVYGGRVGANAPVAAAPVRTPVAQNVGNRVIPANTPGPAYIPPRGAQTPGHRPPKKQRKAAKQQWKKAGKTQAQETTTTTKKEADKTIKTGSLWKNPYVIGGGVAAAGLGTGAAAYTLREDSKAR
jgi:hypothetical protein